MSLPVASFAALPAGVQPLSLFDQQFAAVAQSGRIECTASGTNVITLTPIAGQYSPVVNTDGAPVYSWTQPGDCTGPVTINVSGIGPFAAYKNYGQQPIGAGDLKGGSLYTCAWSSTLAGGAGVWVTDFVQAAGIPEAPSDGFSYGRLNAAWTQVLPLAGGTMTGALNLSHDPIIPQEAATKAYVDSRTPGGGGGMGGVPEAPTDGFTYGRLNAAWSAALGLGGGTMLGPVTLYTGSTAPTPASTDNSTLVATTAFVKSLGTLPSGGLAGQALIKNSTIAFDTTWGGPYLPLAGGTLTGQLLLNYANPALTFRKTASGQTNGIYGSTGTLPRWGILPGDSSAESGSNAGSNFSIWRYNDAGTGVDAPFYITRSSGQVQIQTTFSCPSVPVGVINGVNSINFNPPAGLVVEGTPTVLYLNKLGGVGTSVNFLYSGGSVGSISVSSTSTAYNTTSDGRLKADLREFNSGPVIDRLLPWDFRWKANEHRGHGLIAQEAVEAYPEAVTYNEENDGWAIDYSKFVPLLIAEIKALRKRVAALEGI